MDRVDIARWRNEHAEVESRVRDVVDTFHAPSIEEATTALERLSQILEKHFEHEEKIYFPNLVQHAPEADARLHEAQLGHQKVRGRLDTLQDLVAQGELSAAQRGLQMLLKELEAHEQSEDELARWLDARVTD